MPDPFEKLAVELSEDAKAKRRKPKADPVPEIVDHDPLGIGDNEVMSEIADHGPGELLDADEDGDEEPGRPRAWPGWQDAQHQVLSR